MIGGLVSLRADVYSLQIFLSTNNYLIKLKLMRKKFNSLCMTAFLFAVAGSASAQTDVTETYIKNPGFESATAVTGNVRTYDKDVKDGESSGLQEVTDWTIMNNGDTKAGGAFAYGSSYFIGGDSYTAPATAQTGGGNNALGILAVWNGSAQYTQSATLPAGTYVLKADVYNSTGGTTKASKCLFGFIADDGSENLASAESYTVNTWSTITATFTLQKTTSGNISIGYTATNAGNGSQQHLFFDNLTLTYTAAAADKFYESINTLLTKAKTLTSSPMNSVVAANLNSAVEAGTAAVGDTKETDTNKLDTIVNNLDDAIAKAEASIKVYAAASVYLIAASSLDDAGKASYAADATVKSIQETYTAKTLVEITSDQETALSEALRTAAKVQTTKGADMTLAIVNPDFETGNITGWTTANSGDTGARSTSSTTYAMTNSSGAYLFNTWSVGTPVTQTVTGLNPGKYTVKAIMATDANKTLVLTLNGTEVTAASVDKGTGVEITNADVVVANGSLTISAGTSDKYWYKADNFTLTFVEAVELDDYYTQITTLVTTAKDITADMSEAASTALTAAIKAGEEATGTTKETEITKLNTVIENLDKTIADAKVSVVEFQRGAAVNELITATSGSVNVSSAVVNDDQFTGWSQSGTGTFQKNSWSDEGKTDGSNMLTPFAQNWTNRDGILADNVMTFNTISGLKAGQYKVSILTRVMNEKEAVEYSGATFCVNDATVNLTEEATALTGRNGVYKTAEAVVTVEDKGSLAISIEVKSANFNWIAFKNLKIVYLNDNVVLTDTVEDPLAADLTANYAGATGIKVSFTRNFTQDVSSTVCLPFEVTPDATAGKFYAFKGVTEKDGVYTVTMTETATTLAANAPYLFVPAADGDVTFTGTVAKAAATYTPTDVTEGEWTFVGTYSKVTYDAEDKWGDYAAIYGFVAKNLDEAQTFKAGEFVKMKKPGSSYTPAFRAVMKYKQATDGGADANVRRSVTIPSSLNVVLENEDGTTTAIGTVDVDTDYADGAWYTIDGRKIQGKPTAKGIYINGGQKVLIK